MPGSGSWKDVLAFWFGWPDASDYGQYRKAWFVKDATFDAAIRERFFGTWQLASQGVLSDWSVSTRSTLALIVVMDQFPRNLFRGDARSFSTDSLALQAACKLVDAGLDAVLLPVERSFVYLPFEHSEDPVMQDRSVQLFAALESHPAGPQMLDYARRHRDVIARFGRFPHRNAALGRVSTPEELDWLAQPGSGF
jgi:uncharacterized protein (DUF924 family)